MPCSVSFQSDTGRDRRLGLVSEQDLVERHHTVSGRGNSLFRLEGIHFPADIQGLGIVPLMIAALGVAPPIPLRALIPVFQPTLLVEWQSRFVLLLLSQGIRPGFYFLVGHNRS